MTRSFTHLGQRCSNIICTPHETSEVFICRHLRLIPQDVEPLQESESGSCPWINGCCGPPAYVKELTRVCLYTTASAKIDSDFMYAVDIEKGECVGKGGLAMEAGITERMA